MCAAVCLLTGGVVHALPSRGDLKLRLTWGERSPVAVPFSVKLSPSAGVKLADVVGYKLETGEDGRSGAWQTTAGHGDTDGVEFTLSYAVHEVSIIQEMQAIWADLIERSDADTARRLTSDPAVRQDDRKLTVQMDAAGSRGFTVTIDQLQRNGSLWIPSLDVFLTTDGQSLAAYEKTIEPWKGQRILERLHSSKEASYSEYSSLWQDMGSPFYVRAQQPKPGHIICLTWDSAIPKFGIDRGGGVWNDYGNPDHFRFWFGFGDLEGGILKTWRSQKLTDGLPFVTTTSEQDGLRYELEQFAYPLNGPPPQRDGEISMVLMQKVRITELKGANRRVTVTLNHRRALPDTWNKSVMMERRDGEFLLEDRAQGEVLLSVRGVDGMPAWSGVKDYQSAMRRANATVFLDIPAHGQREFVVKLPSPTVSQAQVLTLTGLDYTAAHKATARFWQDWLDRGASFVAPEKVVNDLYRANLWHALRLPRRHGGAETRRIDLPYSNFAYSQTGTPWPVNQAVYVDYMLYNLRGYFSVATEELSAILRNNQERDGHVGGNADWFAYTPAMLYAIAKHYELSGDRSAFDRLLPEALKSLDWSLARLNESKAGTGFASGLVNGPLNDITGPGVWAFNQAYLYAGLSEFGRVLKQIGHPRANECLQSADELRRAINTGFRYAAVQSPLVQLRDHTWSPYVPTEALTFGRTLTQWYPTDVDTGALHLVRLGALPAAGELATALLNDHEDNLFLLGRGLANEPVYDQQATAYLLRDDPEAAIRVFYSLLAGGFSQSALEPVEHRWTHGQYFGPPSTDGAWAELYRNMVVRETAEGGLFIGQATPRAWLEDAKEIQVRNAPTEFGSVSFSLRSDVSQGVIKAEVEMPSRSVPRSLKIRLRHPSRGVIRSVMVNGRPWTDFDAAKEWVTISSPREKRYTVEAHY